MHGLRKSFAVGFVGLCIKICLRKESSSALNAGVKMSVEGRVGLDECGVGNVRSRCVVALSLTVMRLALERFYWIMNGSLREGFHAWFGRRIIN